MRYIIVFIVLFSSCSFENPVEENRDYAKEGQGNTKTSSCQSCHDYPVSSGAHTLHLTHKVFQSYNGVISCADCHFKSHTIRKVEDGETRYFPVIIENGVVSTKNESINSLVEIRNYLKEVKSKTHSSVFEIETSSFHFNGTVEVNLSPNSMRKNEAAWDAKKKSCSLVDCHRSSEEVYLWDSHL